MARFADSQADRPIRRIRRDRGKELLQALEGIRLKTGKQWIHRKRLLSSMLVASSGVFWPGLSRSQLHCKIDRPSESEYSSAKFKPVSYFEGGAMTKFLVGAVSFCLLAVSVPIFGQSSNASLSGTVTDPSNSLIPGVTITVTNTDTGVISTGLTNESGIYNSPSLLPGAYTVSASLPGFQTRTFTNVRLGNAAQVRLNFTLELASVTTSVEVTFSADRLLLESTSSVGGALTEKTVRDLPVVGVMGNDALTQVRTLPGLNLANDLVLSANDSKLAGVSAANVNIQRDGADASAAGRWPAGIQAATIINPDLVGEIRMILAPVDAELGRGNAQIQVQTRSGTNRFVEHWCGTSATARSTPTRGRIIASMATHSLAAGPISTNTRRASEGRSSGTRRFSSHYGTVCCRGPREPKRQSSDSLRAKRHLPVLRRLGQR